MANRSKAKGSAFARLIADYLASALGDDRIDRRVETGPLDKGDIGGVRLHGHRLAIEAKNHARMELGQWLKEAVAEAGNDRALAGIVVHKRRGYAKGGDQYATLRLSDLVAILRVLDGVSAAPGKLGLAEPHNERHLP